MNRSFIKILSVVCLLCIISSLFSCQKAAQSTDTSTTIYHTVSFNTNGGSPIANVKIEDGKYLTLPKDPILDNYVFLRWEYQGAPWASHSKKITQNITLDAIWISAETLFAIAPTEDGISLTGITKQEGFHQLYVPSVINGKAVTSVSDGAFELINTGYAEHLIFPSSVTKIGNGAFKDISEVSLTFNGAITQLGESAFEGCTVLESIKLGAGVKNIPYSAFEECTSMKSIDIPEGVINIQENAFLGCTSLSTIVLPSSLTTIENSAFDDCTSIKTVFFKGTQEKFDSLDIDILNDAVLDAKVYFYSEQKPEQDGNFWHYDSSNSPIIW